MTTCNKWGMKPIDYFYGGFKSLTDCTARSVNMRIINSLGTAQDRILITDVALQTYTAVFTPPTQYSFYTERSERLSLCSGNREIVPFSTIYVNDFTTFEFEI